MRNKRAFKSSIPIAPQKQAIRGRMRKKGKIKSLGKESYTMSDPRDYSRNFEISFENLCKTSGLTVNQKGEKN
jgi:hypothetical protein